MAGRDEERQQTLRDELTVDPAEAFGAEPNALGDELQVFGITPETVGRTADEIDASMAGNIYRYQYFTEYYYGDPPSTSEEDGSPVAPVQFRTIIYTVGRPSDALTDHLRDVVNGRQKTLFDTGVYGDPDPGYLSAMEPFVDHNSNIEGPEQVGLTDVEGSLLGVPLFETEFYGEGGETRGLAKGTVNPFAVDEDVVDFGLPGHEVWDLSWNESRGDYQVSPPGKSPSRERVKALRGKEVYVNGRFIGTLAKDGRTWLKKQYGADPGHTNQWRGRTYWSREGLVAETEATYSAIRDDGNLYKVNETDDAILLVTARGKPDDFDPIDPAEVGETAVGRVVDYELRLDETEPTAFTVRSDESIRGALGKYDPPTERSIAERTTFEVIREYGEPFDV